MCGIKLGIIINMFKSLIIKWKKQFYFVQLDISWRNGLNIF